MTQFIEDLLPPIQSAGLNTQKAFTTSSTVSAVGITSTSTIVSTGSITTPATVVALNAGAATAGGNVTPAVTIASTVTGSGVGIYFGNGAPTITAAQGSLYLNTTGSSISTRLFVNTNGATTWTAVTTVA